MKVLLDECVHRGLRALIVGHDVYTTVFMGWNGKQNGELLATAATAGFDVLVTTDQNIEHQQNLSTLPLSVVILVAPSNDIDDVRPLVPALLSALSSLPPKTLLKLP